MRRPRSKSTNMKLHLAASVVLCLCGLSLSQPRHGRLNHESPVVQYRQQQQREVAVDKFNFIDLELLENRAGVEYGIDTATRKEGHIIHVDVEARRAERCRQHRPVPRQRQDGAVHAVGGRRREHRGRDRRRPPPHRPQQGTPGEQAAPVPEGPDVRQEDAEEGRAGAQLHPGAGQPGVRVGQVGTEPQVPGGAGALPGHGPVGQHERHDAVGRRRQQVGQHGHTRTRAESRGGIQLERGDRDGAGQRRLLPGQMADGFRPRLDELGHLLLPRHGRVPQGADDGDHGHLQEQARPRAGRHFARDAVR
ncbi:hypothetical protein FOCC_FOCC012074 [Frankliniella occidentalis]|nr:hypothetical protein FOCC_FOCC012074 [Frankliniella occidentalis]